MNYTFLDTYTNKTGNNLLGESEYLSQQDDQSDTDQNLVFSSPVIESKEDELNNTNKLYEAEED